MPGVPGKSALDRSAQEAVRREWRMLDAAITAEGLRIYGLVGSGLCPRLRAVELEQSCARSVEIEYHDEVRALSDTVRVTTRFFDARADKPSRDSGAVALQQIPVVVGGTEVIGTLRSDADAWEVTASLPDASGTDIIVTGHGQCPNPISVAPLEDVFAAVERTWIDAAAQFSGARAFGEAELALLVDAPYPAAHRAFAQSLLGSSAPPAYDTDIPSRVRVGILRTLVVQAQRSLTGHHEAQAKADIDRLAGQILALARTMSWMQHTELARAAADECIQWAALHINVRSLPAQLAWEQRDALRASNPLAGTTTGTESWDPESPQMAEWRSAFTSAEATWEHAWRQWADTAGPTDTGY